MDIIFLPKLALNSTMEYQLQELTGAPPDEPVTPGSRVFYAHAQGSDLEQPQLNIVNRHYNNPFSEFQDLCAEDQEAISIIKKAMSMAKNPLLRQHLTQVANFEQKGGSQPAYFAASRHRNHPLEMRVAASQGNKYDVRPTSGELLQGAMPQWEPRTSFQTPLHPNSKLVSRNRPWTSHNALESDAGRRGLKPKAWQRDRIYSNNDSTEQLLSMAQEHSNRLANLRVQGMRDAEAEQAIGQSKTKLINTNSHDFSNWNPDLTQYSAVERRKITNKSSLAGAGSSMAKAVVLPQYPDEAGVHISKARMIKKRMKQLQKKRLESNAPPEQRQPKKGPKTETTANFLKQLINQKREAALRSNSVIEAPEEPVSKVGPKQKKRAHSSLGTKKIGQTNLKPQNQIENPSRNLVAPPSMHDHTQNVSPDSFQRMNWFYSSFLNASTGDFMAKRNGSQKKMASTQISQKDFNLSTENQDALPTIADSQVQHGRIVHTSMLLNQERDLSIPEIESSKIMAQSLIEPSSQFYRTQDSNTRLSSIQPGILQTSNIKASQGEVAKPKKKKKKAQRPDKPRSEPVTPALIDDEEQVLLDILKQKLKAIRSKRQEAATDKAEAEHIVDDVLEQFLKRDEPPVIPSHSHNPIEKQSKQPHKTTLQPISQMQQSTLMQQAESILADEQVLDDRSYYQKQPQTSDGYANEVLQNVQFEQTSQGDFELMPTQRLDQSFGKKMVPSPEMQELEDAIDENDNNQQYHNMLQVENADPAEILQRMTSGSNYQKLAEDYIDNLFNGNFFNGQFNLTQNYYAKTKSDETIKDQSNQMNSDSSQTQIVSNSGHNLEQQDSAPIHVVLTPSEDFLNTHQQINVQPLQVKVNTKLLKQPKQNVMTVQETMTIQVSPEPISHSLNSVSVTSIHENPAVKEINDKLVKKEIEKVLNRVFMINTQTNPNQLSQMQNMVMPLTSDSSRYVPKPKQLTQIDLLTQHRKRLEVCRKTQSKFNQVIEDQMHEIKKTRLTGLTHLKQLKFRDRGSKLVNFFEQEFFDDSSEEEETKIDKQLEQMKYKFQPHNYFEGIATIVLDDEESAAPPLRKPIFGKESHLVKTKTLMNLLKPSSNLPMLDQQLVKIQSYISGKKDMKSHDSRSSPKPLEITFQISRERNLKKIMNQSVTQTQSITYEQTETKKISPTNTRVEGIYHLANYLDVYTMNQEAKHLSRHQKRVVISDEMKLPNVQKTLKNYIIGIFLMNSSIADSKVRVRLLKSPIDKLIEVSDLMTSHLTQINPPLLTEIDDEANVIEQEVSIIKEHVMRNLKNKLVRIGAEGREMAILTGQQLRDLEEVLIVDLRHLSRQRTKMFLFSALIKNKVEYKIQEGKDLKKVEQFMKYQDMAWKQSHDHKQFIQLENPNKMSKLRIESKVDVFNVSYNSEMVAVYGHMSWAPMQAKCQDFQQRVIDLNRQQHMQKFNFKINKFMRTHMQGPQIRNMQGNYVQLKKTLFTLLSRASQSQDQNKFDQRIIPVKIKFKKAFCRRKVHQFIQETEFDTQYPQLAVYLERWRQKRGKVKGMIYLHDKQGTPTSIHQYLAWQMLQRNDRINMNLIIFGENSHSLFLRMHDRKRRQVDFHILMTRILQNLHESQKQSDPQMRIKAIETRQTRKNLEEIGKRVRETRRKSLECGISPFQFMRHKQLIYVMFLNAQNLSFCRNITLKKIKDTDLQQMSQEEIQRLITPGYQTMYEEELPNEAPFIRRYRHQNAVDHYDKTYRNFIISTFLEPLVFQCKDNINIFYKRVEFNWEYDPFLRYKHAKTVYHYGYKCKLFRDPQNLSLFFEILQPTLIDKALEKITDYEKFMRQKKDEKAILQSNSRRQGIRLSKLPMEGPKIKFKYQTKTYVKAELEQIIHVDDFETDEEMRDLEFSDFESVDLQSQKSDMHLSPKNKTPKKRKSIKNMSSIVNLLKGKITQELHPYQHYQKLKLLKLKKLLSESKNIEKAIYKVISNFDLRNQLENQNALENQNQAMINRVINQARVFVSKDNFEEIQLHQDEGRAYFRKIKHASIRQENIQLENQHPMYLNDYNQMLQKRYQMSQQKFWKLQGQASKQSSFRTPKTNSIDFSKLKISHEENEFQLVETAKLRNRIETEITKRKSKGFFQLEKVVSQEQQIGEIEKQELSDSNSQSQDSIKSVRFVPRHQSISMDHAPNQFQSHETSTPHMNQFKQPLIVQKRKPIRRMSSMAIVIMPHFKLIYQEDQRQKKKIDNIIKNTSMTKAQAIKLHSTHDKLVRQIVCIDQRGKEINVNRDSDESSSKLESSETDSQEKNMENVFKLGNELELMGRYEQKKFQKQSRLLQKRKQKEALRTLIQRKDHAGLEAYHRANAQLKRFEVPQGKLTPQQFLTYNKKLQVAREVVYVKKRIGIDFRLPELAEQVQSTAIAIGRDSLSQARAQNEELSRIMGKVYKQANRRLRDAVIAGERVQVGEIMERFQVDYENSDARGNSLVMIAVLQRDLEMLRVLLTKEFDINHRNREGNTALHYAVSSGSTRIVSFLLNKGAREDIENNDGLTCWQTNPAF